MTTAPRLLRPDEPSAGTEALEEVCARPVPPISAEPLLTLVLLNFEGGPWLERCLASIRGQTVFDQLELTIADNASEDGSDRLAAGLVHGWPRARVHKLGANLGYSAGNNRAAEQARGRYLFFLNTDTWLEPDCIEHLIQTLEATKAVAVTPLVMDYADDTPQFASYAGFDIFGLLSPQRLERARPPHRPDVAPSPHEARAGRGLGRGAALKHASSPQPSPPEEERERSRLLADKAAPEDGPSPRRGGFGPASGRAPQGASELFVAGGCSLLVRADWFWRLGGFDQQFFMYADEYDLCWRIWVAGGKVVFAPRARLHHRSAAAVNPRGGQRLEEIRTSDTKRYYANRNNLLVLLKNSQHLLLAFVPLQILLLAGEVILVGVLARRWSHIHRSYIAAVVDCWRMRAHIVAQRRRLRALRRHGDFWMLRFLRGRLNRWSELSRCFRLGLPKVDAK